MVSPVLEDRFEVLSRHSDMEDVAESWTRRRYFDDAKVQLDSLIGDMRAQTKAVWMDNSLPIGLDHRCVHCLLAWENGKHKKQPRRTGLKHWQPHFVVFFLRPFFAPHPSNRTLPDPCKIGGGAG